MKQIEDKIMWKFHKTFANVAFTKEEAETVGQECNVEKFESFLRTALQDIRQATIEEVVHEIGKNKISLTPDTKITTYISDLEELMYSLQQRT